MSRPQDRIEIVLADLATHIDWPDDADVTLGVRDRLTRSASTPSRKSSRWQAAAAVAILVVLVVLVVPPAREAVAELLGIRGVAIEITSDTIPESDATVDLGEQISLDEAIASTDFELLVPEVSLGSPDGVYLDDRGAVTMVWVGEESLPAAGNTGVATMYTQFNVPGGENLFLKEVYVETDVKTVAVADRPGYWLQGGHVVSYLDPNGEMREVVANHVLLWEANGVSHRIETTMSLDQTLEIAESLTPVE